MTCPKEQKQTLLNKWLRQKYDTLVIIIKVKDSFRVVKGLLYLLSEHTDQIWMGYGLSFLY